MLQFSQLTLDQAVDRVFIQMSQHRTATNLDYGTVAMFINLSIREAIIKTCLLSTSDAADEEEEDVLGCRRLLKKKNT